MNVIILSIAAWLYFRARIIQKNTIYTYQNTLVNNAADRAAVTTSVVYESATKETILPVKTGSRIDSLDKYSSQELSSMCTEVDWCNIEMPLVSHFKFEPPNDPVRWKKAQIHAQNGDQILLEKIMKYFPHPFGYIDGDRAFRGLHKIVDAFIDSKQGLDFVVNEKIASTIGGISRKVIDADESQPWQKQGKTVVPKPYKPHRRAPIVQLGYFAFNKDNNQFFSGNTLGGNFVDFYEFLEHWKKIKDRIEIPFITLVSLNENWGVFSTMLPNRTAAWGRCCDKPNQRIITEFLDHPMTLMMVINQHSNITHPKVITIPRGVPTTWDYTEKFIWDSQRKVLAEKKRNKLLLAAASNWGPRPQILKCISAKMSPNDFEGHVYTPPKQEVEASKSDRKLYYERLGSTKFGLSLPGLGYDCFRLWELMTMGAVAVIESGIGLDRMLWRLPALLVEDFDLVTPELLRSAYVEAIYYADDFNYEKLTQSYWYGAIYNISASMRVSTITDMFPMHATDPNFGRAREPYSCSHTNTCGPGTRRIPKTSC